MKSTLSNTNNQDINLINLYNEEQIVLNKIKNRKRNLKKSESFLELMIDKASDNIYELNGTWSEEVAFTDQEIQKMIKSKIGITFKIIKNTSTHLTFQFKKNTR